jgi:hypothetical protein
MIRALMLSFALLLAAPDAPALAADVTAAQPQLARIPLTLTTASGRHRYRVEVAATPRQQELGLMFRTRMARAEGMIFPFEPPRPASFWMQNTVLPLDLVFIADGKVLNIAADAVPYSRALIYSQGAAAAVLELNAGEAARIGLKAGDAVAYTLP